jgi:hypothetical protein
MNDRKLFKWLALLIFMPLMLAIFGGDRFRYPCQDPANWDKDMCKLPACDVTRTCPDHIFKGGRDPRLGPPSAGTTTASAPQTTLGANCK